MDEALASLREAIDKWKAENGVTGPTSETAQKRGLAASVPPSRHGDRPNLYALLEGRVVSPVV
jgi:hypothetical protein